MAKKYLGWVVAVMLAVAAYAVPSFAHDWHTVEFENRPLYAYPLPLGRDDLIGSAHTYTDSEGRHAARRRPMVRPERQGNLRRQRPYGLVVAAARQSNNSADRAYPARRAARRES
jgi:hypothetical protein